MSQIICHFASVHIFLGSLSDFFPSFSFLCSFFLKVFSQSLVYYTVRCHFYILPFSVLYICSFFLTCYGLHYSMQHLPFYADVLPPNQHPCEIPCSSNYTFVTFFYPLLDSFLASAIELQLYSTLLYIAYGIDRFSWLRWELTTLQNLHLENYTLFL